MTNEEVAKGLLKQARSRIQAMREALNDKNYAFIVRLSQECVELSLKAALYFMGIDFPKWHDVGPILQRNRARFPKRFEGKIDRFANISERLRGSENEACMATRLLASRPRPSMEMRRQTKPQLRLKRCLPLARS